MYVLPKSYHMNFFSRNGQILPLEQATVDLRNIEYAYGFGVYETLKVRKGHLYFPEKHAQRLLDSAAYIGLPHTFDLDSILRYLHELIHQLQQASGSVPEKFAANLKIMLIGQGQEGDLSILPLPPKFVDRKLYKHGATVATARYERWLPQAKTLNMLPSYILFTQASKLGAYDVLFIDSENVVREGSRTNLFFTRGRKLYTTPQSLVLSGVTRDTVIQVAQQQGFEIIEHPVTVEEVQNQVYEGAFITSTSTKILPITQWLWNLAKPPVVNFSLEDMHTQNNPEIPATISELQKAYEAFLDQERLRSHKSHQNGYQS
jgi:branched-subunit amino acid aminotransferase/4-amino-4-deoxychorismate lyase